MNTSPPTRGVAERFARDLNATERTTQSGIKWEAGLHPINPDEWVVFMRDSVTLETISYLEVDLPPSERLEAIQSVIEDGIDHIRRKGVPHAKTDS